jgi:hypothetical protein
MFVPWIHGNAPVPPWWRALLQSAEEACERYDRRVRIRLLGVLLARAREVEATDG